MASDYDISQADAGGLVEPQELAALLIAAQGGLRLPLVYHTGGYDALETGSMSQFRDPITRFNKFEMPAPEFIRSRQEGRT